MAIWPLLALLLLQTTWPSEKPVLVQESFLRSRLLQKGELLPSDQNLHAKARIIVDEGGFVESVKLRHGCRCKGTDRQAAIDYLNTWRFYPFLVDGTPLRMEADVHVLYDSTRGRSILALGEDFFLVDEELYDGEGVAELLSSQDPQTQVRLIHVTFDPDAQDRISTFLKEMGVTDFEVFSLE